MQKTNKKIFNHLKVHTQYSICEGALNIKDLYDHCKKNKIQSIGLSDNSNLCGALEFSENISKAGTQPIIGTQIVFNYEDFYGSLPLIAQNEKGYKRIIELSSKSFLENDREFPFCKLDELFNNNEGLIIFSGSVEGFFGKLFNKGKITEIKKLYKKLSKIYNNNFYIEIQRHNDDDEKSFELFNLKESFELKIPLIATNEVYYLDESMHEAHDALTCIGSKTYVYDTKRRKLSKHHYLKTSEEMYVIFSDLPEALENNYNFPYRCNYRPLPSKPILPKITNQEGEENDYLLRKKSEEALKNKFLLLSEGKNINLENDDKYNIYKKRLEHELNIIKQMNYSSYFLIVSDYIKWAKVNNIPVGPGRGSGAGSLVAWCMSITDIDPIKFNLIFERFLNPERISMPDFDIDFCEEKRDLVFKYLASKYKDCVAHIITFGKLKARMVIRDVGRVLGLPYGFVDNICKMIPFDPSRPMSLLQCINTEPRLKKLVEEDKRVKKLVDLSLKLEGLNRNIATHAAGVVIADKKLTTTVPLYKDNTSNLLLPSTQFDMYSAENAGLVKFDFLGLKTLTIINKTSNLINKYKDFKIDTINYEDQKVFDLLSTGKTVGLFQLESSGMRDALVNMKPNRLEDIIALVALYRPGPMSNIPIYNECKHGKRKPDYLHPKLQKILEPTYGVIIYQEQVMQIAQTLSGFTAGEADILRRAMGKKKRKELEEQKQRFIEGAYKNGISKEIAASIFLKIEPFAEYGFNKSHAAAYAIIAYQTAYLKTYFPHEFFSASMSMEMSSQKKLSEFYDELKRLKINIVRPDINLSYANFKSENKNFYYALGALKNVGYESILNIIEERSKNGKFSSFQNFLERVNPKDINKLQLEGLVKSGAFDSLNKNRQSIYNSIPNLILKSKSIFENKLINQKNLFELSEDQKEENFLEKIEDWKFEEKLSKEFETVGFFISDHPLNQFKNLFNEYKIINFYEFNSNDDLLEGNIAGTVLKIQEKKTQKGNSYAILKLSDLNGVFETFIFSEILETNRNILIEGNSILLTLTKSSLSEENRFKRINVKKIISLKEIINKPINNIKFYLNEISELKILNKISNHEGTTKVHVVIKNDNKNLVFSLKNKRKVDNDLINLLKNEGISSEII